MLKLYSSNIAPDALRKRLDEYISTPHEALPLSERLRPSVPGIKERLRYRYPLLVRLANAGKNWRASGYSPRWLIERLLKRLPGVHRAASTAWILFNIRAFRRDVQGEIESLKNLLLHVNEQNRQLLARAEEENRLLAARVKSLEIDVRMLERAARCPPDAG
jgi:hypothetical protein